MSRYFGIMTGNTIAQAIRAETKTSPMLFLLVVILIMGVLCVLPKGEVYSEPFAVAYSSFVALIVWLIVLSILCRNEANRAVCRSLNILLLFKVVFSFLYYYLVFTYFNSFDFGKDVIEIFSGVDVEAVHFCAVKCTRELRSHGLWYSIFGDYYRSINNPGISVVYGILYSTFDAYPAVAIPWNTVAMGLAAFLVVAICQHAGFSRGSTLCAMYLTVLMPSFFMLNPLYRDQFMIMLILMIVFSIVYMWTYRSFVSLIPFFFSSICLAFLRVPFATAPVAILAISIFTFAYKRRERNILALCVLGTLCIFLYTRSDFLLDSIRLQEQPNVGGHAVLFFGDNLIGRSLYILLTPMPWYQKINLGLLTYQIVDYPQTVLSLTVLSAVWYNRRHVIKQQVQLFLCAAFLVFLTGAAIGSMLAQRYLQIALPLVIIPASPFLIKHRFECLRMACLIIVVAHVCLELVRIAL